MLDRVTSAMTGPTGTFCSWQAHSTAGALPEQQATACIGMQQQSCSKSKQRSTNE